MSESWFYSDGGRSFGPVSDNVIRTLIADGTIGREHFVMPEDGEDWQKLPDSKFADGLEDIWYYSDGSETFGPYPENTLRELIGSGQVEPHFFVMRGSESDWTGISVSRFGKTSVAGVKLPGGPVTPVPLKRNDLGSRTKEKSAEPDSEGKTPPGRGSSDEDSPAMKFKAEVPKAPDKSEIDEVANLRKEVEASHKEAEEWMRRVAEAEKERADALRECQAVTKHLARKDGDTLKLNERLNQAVEVGKDAKKELARLREELAETKKNFSEAKDKLKEAEARTQDAPATEELEKLKADLSEVKKEREEQADKARRFGNELAETSSLLVKARNEGDQRKERIEQLLRDLSKAKSEIDDLRESGSDAILRNRVQELEQQLETKPETGDQEEELKKLEAKLMVAETEAEVAEDELKRVREQLRTNTRVPRKSSRLPWLAAAAAFVAACVLGYVAWEAKNNASPITGGTEDLDELKKKLAASEQSLEQTGKDLETARGEIVNANNAAKAAAMRHADFTAKLLDQFAAAGGRADPDTIARMRRETEEHFGLADNLEEVDGERARHAGTLVADGDKLREQENFDAARTKYREATLIYPELLRKYPSNAFWRGDLISAYAKLAGAELALGNLAESEESLAYAESQLDVLGKDDSDRAGTRAAEVASIWEELGNNFASSGKYDRARQCLEMSLARYPEDAGDGSMNAVLLRHHTKLGQYAAQSGDWLDSDVHYTKAAELTSSEESRMALNSKIAEAKRKLKLSSAAAELSEKVLAFRKEQVEQDPSVANRLELVGALNKSGEVRRDGGDVEGAKQAHEEAEKILQELLASSPPEEQHRQIQKELALTSLLMGELELVSKNYAVAREKFTLPLPTLRMLSGQDPDSPDILLKIQHAHLNIAWSHAQENDHDSALAAYEKALGTAEQLRERFPNNQAFAQSSAMWMMSVGNYQRTLEKLDVAVANLRRSLAIYEELSKANEDNLEFKKQIADLNRMLGDLELKRNPTVAVKPEVIEEPGEDPAPTDPDPAVEEIPTPPVIGNQSEPYFREALEKAKELAEANPADQKLQQQLGLAHERLAEFLNKGGRFVDAQAEFLNSLTIREKLLKSTENPEPVWLHEVARTYKGLALLQAQIGTLPIAEQYQISALSHGEQAIRAAEKAGQGVPAAWFAQVGESNLELGKLDQLSRQYYQARRRFQDAVDILRQITEKHDDTFWKLMLVEAYGGLSINWTKGDPKDVGISQALAAKGLEILKELDAEGKLTDAERDWFAQLKKLAGLPAGS